MRFMLTGLPVSGSTSASMPVFSTMGGPPEITYFRFAAGRGRRKTETVGWALLSPYSRLVLHPVGSRTTSIVNSTRLCASRPRSSAATKRNPEQAALEQQRMRAFLVLRQIRAVGTVERREHGILAVGRLPAGESRRPRRSSPRRADDSSRRRARWCRAA